MDDAKVENELTERWSVSQAVRWKVDRHAIKKARIHLLQAYNTDQKRNAGATDKHFAIVQNWVRDFLVEWDSCEDFQDRVNGSAETQTRYRTRIRKTTRPSIPKWPTRYARCSIGPDKRARPRTGQVWRRGWASERESLREPGFGAAEFGRRPPRFEAAGQEVSVCINRLKKREDIAARIAGQPGRQRDAEAGSYKAGGRLFLSHRTQEGGDLCCARYADAFFNMMTGKHTGINFPFSVDAAFVDNLFHLITNLPKDAWRDRDRGFGHASLMMVKAVGKAAMQRAFKEVWP